MSNEINWDVFTLEDKNLINQALKAGDYSNLINVITNVDPEKEYEIQKLFNLYAPEGEEFISRAQKEVEQDFLQLPQSEMTPEKEKEYQDKLDAEKEDFSKKKKVKDEKKLGALKKLKKEEVVKDKK
jgi:hypothetical protein